MINNSFIHSCSLFSLCHCQRIYGLTVDKIIQAFLCVDHRNFIHLIQYEFLVKDLEGCLLPAKFVL